MPKRCDRISSCANRRISMLTQKFSLSHTWLVRLILRLLLKHHPDFYCFGAKLCDRITSCANRWISMLTQKFSLLHTWLVRLILWLWSNLQSNRFILQLYSIHGVYQHFCEVLELFQEQVFVIKQVFRKFLLLALNSLY